jgi:hypothetical protein
LSIGDLMREMIERAQQIEPEVGGIFFGMGGQVWC